LGLNGPQTIEFMYGLGSVTTGNGRIITVIGKLDGTKRVKDQFGYFTHIEVGENANGVNFLNMPNTYWNGPTWYQDYNQDWMLRGIERGDDFYIVNPITDKTLYNFTDDNIPYGSYFANELNELIVNDKKPVNITLELWENLIPDIQRAANTVISN
jgi:hypothetical protein